MENTSSTLTLNELETSLEKYQSKLDDLRKDGVFRLRNLKNENKKIAKDKNIEKEVKKTLISSNKSEIETASKVIRQTKGDIADVVGEAREVLNTNYNVIYKEKVAELNKQKTAVNEEHLATVENIKNEYQKTYGALLSKYAQPTLTPDQKASFDAQINELETSYKEKIGSLNAQLEHTKLPEAEEASYQEKINSLTAQKDEALTKIKGENALALAELKASTPKEELQEALKKLKAEQRHRYFDKENEFDDKIFSIQKEHDNKLLKLSEPIQTQIKKETSEYSSKKEKIYANFGLKIEDAKYLQNKKTEFRNAKMTYKNRLYQEKQDYRKKLSNIKDEKHEAFQYRIRQLQRLTDNHIGIVDEVLNRAENYVYNFKLVDFLLRNCLYFIIIVFFIYAIIGTNGNILTRTNIIAMSTQVSTKLFYSLGVAGLILLAGTDLSIGRITALGGCIALMACGRQVYEGAFFGGTINVIDLSMGVRVFTGLSLSILACTFFSTIAGFFTAKFKMHPFITTLSTQLIIFGLMLINFSSFSAFNVDSTIKSTILGNNQINLIWFAITAIVIFWFIWNRTKFGKNMYAVGGNSEAAAVSGISVFWTTLFVFIMAGVSYGIGGFLEGLRVGVGTSNLGSGTELDAIAACVIGGISFSGGIGKIRGAVIGTIIFTCLTYCLTSLGYDTNMQYIFKGAIIMVAVCLDSLKYLKKK